MFTRKKWLAVGALASAMVTIAASPSLAAGGWSVTTVSAGSGNNVTLNAAFARTNTDAWAVGAQFAPAGATPPAPPTFHWNGTGWSYVPTPALGVNAALYSVSASSATDAWAVGSEISSYSSRTTLLERWNGTAWTVDTADAVSSRRAILDSVLDLSASNAYAIGTGPAGTLFEHWDGGKWSQLALPDTGFRPSPYGESISASSPSDIWVVGTSFSASTGQTVAEALHYNGIAWAVVPMAQPAAGTPAITTVTAISPTDAWAVGLNGTPLTENWNGKAWTIVPSPAPNGVFVTRFTGVAARSANDVIAVGTGIPSAVNTGGEQAVILRWNGTSWSDDTGGTITGGYYAAATFPGAAKEFVVGYTGLGAILTHN
jgi:hypothetical protein